MTSRGLGRALAFAAAVAAVVAGASCSDLRDEGAGADVDRAAVVEARPPALNVVPAVVPDAAPVQQPVETGDGAGTDADTSAVPEVAGDFAEPAQVVPSAPASYVQQSEGQYVVEGGPLTLVDSAQDAADAAGGLEVPGQGYPGAVGPHVEVGDSPVPTGASGVSGASAAAQQVYTEGVAIAPHRYSTDAETQVRGEVPATAR